MKSLCDEIQLRWEMDGFNFICEADFIRVLLGFHRAKHDFIIIIIKPKHKLGLFLYLNYRNTIFTFAEGAKAEGFNCLMVS